MYLEGEVKKVKLPFKYQVLEVLVKECESSSELSISNIEDVVAYKFPRIAISDLRSVILELQNDRLIKHVGFKNDNVIESELSPRARAVLISVQEQMQEKQEARNWQIKSMAIGYAFGVVSGLLLAWLKILLLD